MSNLDVSLRLRMINQIGGPAKDAKRELEGLGTAAKKLDGAKGDKLARDLAKTGVAAKSTEYALNQAATGARKLETTRADRLAAQLKTATINSDRLASSLKRVRTEASASGTEASANAVARARARLGGALPYMAAAGLGAAGVVYAGVRAAGAAKQSFQDFAELDRRMTRLGITADATKAQVDSATVNVRDIARQYAVPVEEALKGLEALVTQGKELPEALSMLGPIVKAAQASGASVEDMSNSAGSMLTNLGFKVDQLAAGFDRLAFAGKKGQFELKDMARYFPELASGWANVGQKGADKLADLAAATQIVRKQTGTAERTASGLRDLMAKVNSTDVQRNFKKMGVDLEGGLKKGHKEGKAFFDILIELTEKATKGDMSQLPKLFGEIDSRQAISALVNLKEEFRSLRAEIQTTAVGTINTDIARVTNDAQASIDRLSNAWSAAGTAVGKFIAEATPAVSILEGISRGIDGTRTYLSGDGKKKEPHENPRRPTHNNPFVRATTRFAHEGLTPEPKPEEPAAWPGAASPVPFLRNYLPVPPAAASEAETTMQRIRRAVTSESAKAVDESRSAAEQIKQMWNFSVSPEISPRFGGVPNGNGPSLRDPTPMAPAPAAPGKRAAGGGGVQIHVTVNGSGKDGRQIGSEIARQLAKLGDSSSALFDTV